MYSDIFLETKTVDQQKILVSEINLLLNALYSADQNQFESVLKDKVREKISSIISKNLASASLDKQEYLEGLLKELNARQVLKLTLSFEPSEEFTDKIFAFVHGDKTAELLLDFDLDHSILAGAIIYYQGKYYNHTLDKIFENLKPQVEELIWKNLKNT